MGKFFALAAFISASLLPATADACRRMEPSAEALDRYESVFVGRITGLHLEGYENSLLSKPDLVDPELGALHITNGSSPVSVRVAVSHSIRGSSSGAIELRLAGCTFDLPQLREAGIFFVHPGGEAAVVAWERDQASYKTWLTQLGVAENDR